MTYGKHEVYECGDCHNNYVNRSGMCVTCGGLLQLHHVVEKDSDEEKLIDEWPLQSIKITDPVFDPIQTNVLKSDILD
jgi:hypothetical protein